MLICVDAGNTNITFGIYKNNELVCTFRSDTKETTSVDKLIDDFNIGLNEYGLIAYDMEFAMIASVVDRIDDILKEFCKKINVEYYFINYLSPLGLTNKLENIEETGADLLVGAYQASKKYVLPLVVVDMGTATTLLVVSEKKEILGGAILPGVMSSYDNLFKNASKLAKLNVGIPSNVISKNTMECMRSGMVYGTSQSINGMIELMKDELNVSNLNVVITGGIASFIYPFINGAIYDDNLIIEGLKDIYEDIGKKLYLRTKEMHYTK